MQRKEMHFIRNSRLTYCTCDELLLLLQATSFVFLARKRWDEKEMEMEMEMEMESSKRMGAESMPRHFTLDNKAPTLSYLT